MRWYEVPFYPRTCFDPFRVDAYTTRLGDRCRIGLSHPRAILRGATMHIISL